MIIDLNRLGKKPFFTVTDEEGEQLGLVDFEGKAKLVAPNGTETDAAVIREIVAESENRIAKSHAYFLLSRRDYAAGELKKKLIDLPVNEEAADFAVEYLCEMGYIRDDEYAERVALRYARGGYGIMKIRAELKRKDFDGETCEAVLAKLSEEFDFIESAREAAVKKYGDVTNLVYEEKAKVTAFLARRGFTYGQISTALE